MGFEMADWTGISIKTAPSVEPVSAADLRAYLRLDDTSQDTMLAGIISGVRAAVEIDLGRTLITTHYYLDFDEFPCVIELARPPVQSVTSITYTDTDGTVQTLSTSLYRTDLTSLYPRIIPVYGEVFPATLNTTNAMRVEYKAGYGDAATNVPQAIREAIKMLAADIFEHSEASVELNLSENRQTKYLLAAYRIPRNCL